MGASLSAPQLSVYVHIPFCSRRCDYCDFATWTDKQENVNEYIDAVVRQWEYSFSRYNRSGVALTSIFFGGGTPNFIDARHIARIIESISAKLPIVDETEITVESNPDHVSQEKMHIYAAAGVNRISLGIQSTQEHVLRYLGREHHRNHVLSARDIIAQSGISNINGDLIYGSPNETMSDWETTLHDIMNLELTHVSAYALGIEPGTPLGQSVAAHEKEPTNDDDLADKYEFADEFLGTHGFGWYEISNWSRPGFESQHNLSYWRGRDVIAIGCAAHGYTHNARWSTPRHIETYLNNFSELRHEKELTDDIFLDQDVSTHVDREQELFSLQLRTRDGVSWPDENSRVMNQFVREGFIDFNPQSRRVSLTVSGRLMAHRIMVDLYEEYEQIDKVVE